MVPFSAMRTALLLVLALCACRSTSPASVSSDPLPSWNAGPAKQALLAFVSRTTDPASRDFVPPAERIAVFDNDGTLWSEQPFYFQALFALDRVRALAPSHPEWNTTEPFASVLSGDLKSALAGGEKSLLELVMATHSGMTTADFERTVREWLATRRHPQSGRPYTEMVYQPMLEVLAWLRAEGFKTYVVSGGGIEFVRVFAEEVYGVPPEQVVGSTIKVKYELRDGKPVIVRLPEVDFIDDKEGKPLAIQRHIGRRPTMAFGNSDGDFQMLEWTTSAPGPRFGLLVHHTDAVREWAYDRDSHIGRLARGLDEAKARGWVVARMDRDWTRVHP